jgi:hypothetical protein
MAWSVTIVIENLKKKYVLTAAMLNRFAPELMENLFVKIAGPKETKRFAPCVVQKELVIKIETANIYVCHAKENKTLKNAMSAGKLP